MAGRENNGDKRSEKQRAVSPDRGGDAGGGDLRRSAGDGPPVEPGGGDHFRILRRRGPRTEPGLIVPERFRARHWEGYRHVMATGVTRYGQRLLAVPAMRKDGQRISIEFSIALLKDERGEVTGAAAVVRDVTPRWLEERELKRRLAALEEPGGRAAATGGAACGAGRLPDP